MVAKTVKVGPKHVLQVLFSRIINKFHAKKIQIGKSYNLQNSTKLSYYLHLPLQVLRSTRMRPSGSASVFLGVFKVLWIMLNLLQPPWDRRTSSSSRSRINASRSYGNSTLFTNVKAVITRACLLMSSQFQFVEIFSAIFACV